MPIVVVPTQPGNVFTPGGMVSGTTDFIGPLPTDTFWRWTLFADDGEVNAVWVARFQTQNHHDFHRLLTPAPGLDTQLTDQVPAEGTSVRVLAELVSNGNVIDSGAQVSPWSSTAGLGVQAFVQESTTGGGLTPEQGLLLQETHDATFPSQLIDTLTLLPLTSGPTGEFVGAQLPNPTFGVIVRIANVPLELVPNTPDGDYWVPSLAVVRIFRGADLWKRVPVHTSSKLVELLDESIVAGITAITATQWLLNMTVQVTFREGVTGEVFLLKVP